MASHFSAGIYINFSSENHIESLQWKEIIDYCQKIPGVKTIWNSNSFPVTDPQLLAEEIRSNDVNCIVITGFKPGYIKSGISKAMKMAEKNPQKILLADVSTNMFSLEHYTEYAKAVIACAIYNVPFEKSLITNNNPVRPDTLVIGGGIAGIQASLEIADSHNKVFLLEKTGTIGGHMAMFDKTFPTLDCAACILTPKMVEVGQHAFIELLTYSEIKEVTGIPGNYKVKILKKARRVNVNTCTGCGTCAEKCPGRAKSEFDAGTTMRKAIYMPFPQAVPNKYLIDAEACTYVQKGKCGNCVKVCPVENCINLDEKDELIEITVGNIVIATGFKTFDAGSAEQYGYGKYPNVITSLELERLVNAAGPTGGNIRLRSKDKKGNWIFDSESPEPKSIALIHCIGSRDENYNKYCSRVCCMYSLKLAHLVKEKIPSAEVFEYYIDMRAYGKEYEEFYQRISEEVHIIRGRTAKIEEKNNSLLLRTEDIEHGRLIEQEVDMVVLAVGMEPNEDAVQLSGMLGLSRSSDGWMKEADNLSNSTDTLLGGITLAGTCQGPKDIPDTVVQASAAASHVLQSILRTKINQNMADMTLEKIEEKARELSPFNGV